MYSSQLTRFERKHGVIIPIDCLYPIDGYELQIRGYDPDTGYYLSTIQRAEFKTYAMAIAFRCWLVGGDHA